MAEKDNWDKLEIAIKFAGAVVLAAIPLVIKYSADNIAQSLERGRLVQSLITDLTQRETQARRDIALVALDAAVPEKQECHILGFWGCEPKPDEDQVVDVALILLSDVVRGASNSGQPVSESTIAKKIIIKRASNSFYNAKLNLLLEANRGQATSEVNPGESLPESEVQRRATTSQIVQRIQPEAAIAEPALAGVRLVYIQYQKDRSKAERLQKYLQAEGVAAPGIESVPGIRESDIRYANAADAATAQRLKDYLQKQFQDIQFNLVDLSKSGYKVSPGQFEIWLKD